MGYTLLYTLSELWFGQFCNFVLLCTCLLVNRVSFFVCQLLLSWRKSRVVFCLSFCFCWEQAEILFQFFYTKYFLCHVHCRFFAMSTQQSLYTQWDVQVGIGPETTPRHPVGTFVKPKTSKSSCLTLLEWQCRSDLI